MDQPRGRLADASREHAWQRSYWLWEVYFAACYVILVALLLGETQASPAGKAGAITTLTSMAVWYLAVGRHVVARSGPYSPWRARIFVLGLLALLIVGMMFEAPLGFVLFAVCPLTFKALELREAILAIIPATMVPVLNSLLQDGFHSMFYGYLPVMLISITFAVLFGTWIHRVITQSEERAALIQELEASREEVERLSREAGVSAERARLAAEIHDTLAQGFTSLVTLVQAVESELDGDREKARRHLGLAARTARENLDEARALVAGLRPSALGTGTLDEAIRRQVERLEEEMPIAATYEVEGESAGLPTALEVVLLRAVQESLTNVRKHSGAAKVAIRLRVNESTARLEVADDGRGFDSSRTADGFGLLGMRSRAEHVGGSLSVHSGASGTEIELEVPR